MGDKISSSVKGKSSGGRTKDTSFIEGGTKFCYEILMRKVFNFKRKELLS